MKKRKLLTVKEKVANLFGKAYGFARKNKKLYVELLKKCLSKPGAPKLSKLNKGLSDHYDRLSSIQYMQTIVNGGGFSIGDLEERILFCILAKVANYVDEKELGMFVAYDALLQIYHAWKELCDAPHGMLKSISINDGNFKLTMFRDGNKIYVYGDGKGKAPWTIMDNDYCHLKNGMSFTNDINDFNDVMRFYSSKDAVEFLKSHNQDLDDYKLFNMKTGELVYTNSVQFFSGKPELNDEELEDWDI